MPKTIRRMSKAQLTNGRASLEAHTPEHLAWYAGLTLMALVEIIEWPVAVAIAVGHEIAHRSRNRALREFAEGVEAGG